jgi:hypothetical protein
MSVKRYEARAYRMSNLTERAMEESVAGDYVSYADYQSLEAEVAELRKDAERYRLLRKHTAMPLHLSNSKFDAAIDALAQTQPLNPVSQATGD